MWIRLVPRQRPLIDLPVEQMDILVNIVWGDKTDIFKRGRREPFGAWFVNRIRYLVDQEEVNFNFNPPNGSMGRHGGVRE